MKDEDLVGKEAFRLYQEGNEWVLYFLTENGYIYFMETEDLRQIWLNRDVMKWFMEMRKEIPLEIFLKDVVNPFLKHCANYKVLQAKEVLKKELVHYFKNSYNNKH